MQWNVVVINIITKFEFRQVAMIKRAPKHSLHECCRYILCICRSYKILPGRYSVRVVTIFLAAGSIRILSELILFLQFRR